MERTSIQVSEKLAEELFNRKKRKESYEDVIWRLIDDADRNTTSKPKPEGSNQPKRPETKNSNPTPPPSTTEEPAPDTPASTENTDLLEAMDVPQGKNNDDAREAVYAARDYLEENGPASMREIVTDVMPDYPLGYDVPQLEPGDRYRGAWWRRIIQPGLKALDDVEYRSNHSDYRVR